MSREISIDVASEDQTRALGAALAAVLPPTAVIALVGPMGAGKTRLVQAVAQAAGVDEGVAASPTFVLVHEYSARVPIFHFDAYRLRDAAEFRALGPEDYFRQGWSFVEWGDRVLGELPAEHLTIAIEVTGDTARRFHIRGVGATYEQTLTALDRQPATERRMTNDE